MENKKTSVRKIALNYGLYMALATIILSVIVYVMGQALEQPWWQSVLNFAILVLFIVYGFKAFKKEGDGFMSLGDALKTGLAITLVSALVVSVYNYVFMNFIEPDFINQMMDKARENMLEQNPNMTDEQLSTAMDFTSNFMKPGIMFAFGMIASLFFGFIVSLITGLIMKQNRPEA